MATEWQDGAFARIYLSVTQECLITNVSLAPTNHFVHRDLNSLKEIGIVPTFPEAKMWVSEFHDCSWYTYTSISIAK